MVGLLDRKFISTSVSQEVMVRLIEHRLEALAPLGSTPAMTIQKPVGAEMRVKTDLAGESGYKGCWGKVLCMGI